MDDSRVVGIYLAAGKSSRMGVSKLNLPLGGQPLGSRAFQSALESSLDITIAVTRPNVSQHWLTSIPRQTGWLINECLEAEEGQSASLKSGVRIASDMGADGLVVLLGDQPFVTSSMINQLVWTFYRFPKLPYLAFSNRGILKPPVLFSKCLFPRLLELKGDQGARALIRGELKGKGMEIERTDEFYLFDIDTKEDYVTAVELFNRRQLQEMSEK